MKTAIITGIINQRSIAFAISESLYNAHYKLFITYQNELIKEKIISVCSAFCTAEFIKLDVTDQNDIDNLVDIMHRKNIQIDALLHSIAFSDKKELGKDFFAITRENFLNSMNISCYSLIELSKKLAPCMSKNGSILTLTYSGSQRVMPHYNVMGIVKAALESSVKYLAEVLGKHNIRINALSAGPVKTVSSFGIANFDYILNVNKVSSPLRRNVTLKDIAGSGLYLLTELSSGVTGEIHHVDCGYNIIGMENPYHSDQLEE